VASAEALLMRGASSAEAAKAVAAAVKPMEDIHADAAYRKDLVVATTQRALEQALA
jgi:CO/xanthine dehydrogenase FAD-binding subunit